jgi:hypothetical protein
MQPTERHAKNLERASRRVMFFRGVHQTQQGLTGVWRGLGQKERMQLYARRLAVSEAALKQLEQE